MQFLSENVGYKYKSQRLANIISHKAQKNRNLDIHFPLKLIKRSVSFGYNRKILSRALIVDPIEMRYAFLNWNISGIMPIVPTSVTQTSQKRGCAEKDRNEDEIHYSPANGLHPSSEKNLPSFCRNRISMFHQHVYKTSHFISQHQQKERKNHASMQKCLNAHLLLAGINNFRQALSTRPPMIS